MKCVQIRILCDRNEQESVDVYVDDNMTDEEILNAVKEASTAFYEENRNLVHMDTFTYQDFANFAKLNSKEFNKYFEKRGLVFTNSVTTKTITVKDNENLRVNNRKK